jgi:large subunit ribosomal protein L23
MAKNAGEILIRARVTEKSAREADRGKGRVYTFDVARHANKAEIAEAVKTVYGVTPRKVSVVNVPRKRIISRGKPGVTAGHRKAMVYLKGDDKIEFA